MLRMAAAPCVHMSSKIDELKSVRSSLKPLKTKQHGIGILHDPLWNKGMAMDLPERDRLNLRGLVPPRVKTLKEQADRIMTHLREFGDDNVRKNMYLQELHNRNETLYHRCLADYIEELAPLVYTPTVGVVCQRFGDQFRRSRGMYARPRQREARVTRNPPPRACPRLSALCLCLGLTPGTFRGRTGGCFRAWCGTGLTTTSTSSS